MNLHSSRGTTTEKFRAAAALHQGGKLDLAAVLYAEILRSDPGHADALHMLGLIALQQDRVAAGVDLIGQSLRHNPRQPMAHANLARALVASGQREAAIGSLGRALQLSPGFADAWLFRANLLVELGRLHEALADYDKALAVNPAFAAAHNNRCSTLLDLKRPLDALASADRALAIDPQFAEAHNNRGNALRMLRHSRESVACFEQALALRPAYPEALSNLCGALYQLKRHEETLPLYERLLQLAPQYPYAEGSLLHAELHCCQWRQFAARTAAIERSVLAGRRAAHPGTLLSVSHAPTTQLRCASVYMEHKFPAAGLPRVPVPSRRHERIRIAYVSSDFGEHPVTHLAAGFLACHDHARFDIHGISLGARDAGSLLQQQLRSSFTSFHDVAELDDSAVAQLLARLEVDIAIDLNGHTAGARPGIFAHRAAAVQATYLGYAGTTGAACFDYLLADAVVIPPGEAGYTEHIVRLPGCYLPRDDRQPLLTAPDRSSEGLPEHAFVFCAFNPAYKVTPVIFDAWMRILQCVPGSVLWLRHPGDVAKANLLREAATRDVEPQRLVFANRVAAHAQHVARHQLADLFLDTCPYNAHTTASDALFAGLPVLTSRGTTFAGRVAESLLRALELPELVATDLAGYEQLAVHLALTPADLLRLRQRLDLNRSRLPPFDTRRFTRHLESAFELMMDRHRRGEPPADIDVP